MRTHVRNTSTASISLVDENGNIVKEFLRDDYPTPEEWRSTDKALQLAVEAGYGVVLAVRPRSLATSVEDDVLAA